MDLDEVETLITEAASEADDEVRPADRPSTAWLKSFRNKLLMGLEDML